VKIILGIQFLILNYNMISYSSEWIIHVVVNSRIRHDPEIRYQKSWLEIEYKCLFTQLVPMKQTFTPANKFSN